MLMPSIFGENLFDNFFDYSFRSQAANAGGLVNVTAVPVAEVSM